MKAHCGPFSPPDFNPGNQIHLITSRGCFVNQQKRDCIWHCVYLFIIYSFRRFHNKWIVFLFVFSAAYSTVHVSTSALGNFSTPGKGTSPAMSCYNVTFFPWLEVLYGKMISFIARGREIIKVKLTKDFSSNWPYGLERKVLMFSFVFQSRCAGS